MKECPACGEDTMTHSHGRWVCLGCQFEHGPVGAQRHRRGERRYKRVLQRLDKIGARLANVRW